MEVKFWLTMIARAALVLAAGILVLRLIENRLVFYPSKAQAGTVPPTLPGIQLHSEMFETADGVQINAWSVTPLPYSIDSPTLMYFHGNAGTLWDRADRFQLLARQGWQVFAIDYRGYGLSAGHPTEAGLYLDAAAAYEFLTQEKHVNPQTIFFYGESLGTAVAIRLAMDRACRGLILEAPFTSFRDMGRYHHPFIPDFVYWFLSNKWDSIGRISQIHAPLFILHGDRDGVVPFSEGRRLYESANPPKEFYTVHGGDHVDGLEVGGADLINHLRRFIDSALKSLPANATDSRPQL